MRTSSATVAQEQNAAFCAGAVFVPLAEVQGSAQFAETLCRFVVGRVQPGLPSLSQVTAHIGSNDMLLVLDHFEHLPDARRDLAQLLNQCPNLVILITSRQRLGLAGEWVFRLGGLGAPPEGMEGSLPQYGAAELFLHTARQARPSNLVAFLWFGRERANLQAAATWAAGTQAPVAPIDRRRLADAIARAGHRWGVHLGSV